MSGLSAEDLADFKSRLESAADRLSDMAKAPHVSSTQREHLRSKAAGIVNALDMLRGYA